MRHQVIDDLVDAHMPAKSYAEQWDTEGLHAEVKAKLGIDAPVVEWAAEEGVDDSDVRERLYDAADAFMASKAVDFGPEEMRGIEKQILLRTIDGKWREHLLTLEHLRSVVGFRGYAQRDPLNEYKTESFQLFEILLETLREDVTEQLAGLPSREEVEAAQRAQMEQFMAQQKAVMAAQQAVKPAADPKEGFDENDPATWGNPARNDTCPCGSGEKFKHCHGKI